MAKYKTVVSIPFLDDSYSIEKYTMETDTIENKAKMTEYIRKQDAFDAVEARITELMTHPEFRRKHLDIDLSGVIRNISAIKPADVTPVVHAYWIPQKENYEFKEAWMKCSACGYPVSKWTGNTNFCPNCGAKMEEDNG